MLLLAVIILHLTILLPLLWFVTGKKIFGMILGISWLFLLGTIFLLNIIETCTSKKDLKQSDIYGEYIIDRNHYSGKQADWQYNHFRFEITEQNEFLFHLMDSDKISQTYKGKVTFLEIYKQPRIILHVDTPRHHIIDSMPTLYRQVWSFYYVFESPKFGNVFFKKGKWKPIKQVNQVKPAGNSA